MNRQPFKFSFILQTLCLCVFAFQTSCAFFGSKGLRHADDYTISVPATWKEIKKAEADRAYRLPNGDVTTLTSSCERRASSPLPLLTRHLLLGARDIEFSKQEEIEIQGEKALYSKLKAKFEGRTMDMELIVTTRDGCIFDFSLISPKKIISENSEQFLTFAKSISYGTD